MPPRIELLGPQPALPNQVSGVIATLDGMTLTLRRRDGTLAFIEFLAAAKSPDFPPIGGGMSITAIGTTDARHTPRQNNHPHHGGKGILAQRSMTGGTIC